MNLIFLNTLMPGQNFCLPLFNRYEYEEGVHVPKQVSLVDVALFCWKSPVIDLSYFFFMSLHPDMRAEHEQDLLEYYHSRLENYLEKFNIDPAVFTLRQ